MMVLACASVCTCTCGVFVQSIDFRLDSLKNLDTMSPEIKTKMQNATTIHQCRPPATGENQLENHPLTL